MAVKAWFTVRRVRSGPAMSTPCETAASAWWLTSRSSVAKRCRVMSLSTMRKVAAPAAAGTTLAASCTHKGMPLSVFMRSSQNWGSAVRSN